MISNARLMIYGFLVNKENLTPSLAISLQAQIPNHEADNLIVQMEELELEELEEADVFNCKFQNFTKGTGRGIYIPIYISFQTCHACVL